MLNIYLGETPSQVIKFNDDWFDEDDNLCKIDFTDDIVENTLHDLDGAIYKGRRMVTTKFCKDAQVRLDVLSTGCKTAINIYTFKDKIFTVDECGENALDKIFELNSGNIHMSFPIWPSRLNNNVNLIFNNKNHITSNCTELRSMIIRYFRDTRGDILDET